MCSSLHPEQGGGSCGRQPCGIQVDLLCMMCPQESILAEVGSMRWGDFKPRLGEAVVEHLRPIQQRYHDVMGDPSQLDAILAQVGGRRV